MSAKDDVARPKILRMEGSHAHEPERFRSARRRGQQQLDRRPIITQQDAVEASVMVGKADDPAVLIGY